MTEINSTCSMRTFFVHFVHVVVVIVVVVVAEVELKTIIYVEQEVNPSCRVSM